MVRDVKDGVKDWVRLCEQRVGDLGGREFLIIFAVMKPLLQG